MNKDYKQWVKNPKTNRLVLVGGSTWRNLVKQNIIDGVVTNPVTKALETKEEVVEIKEAPLEERTDKNKPLNQSEPVRACEADLDISQILTSSSAAEFATGNGGVPPSQKNKKQYRAKNSDITQLTTASAIEIIMQNSQQLAEELEDIACEEDEQVYQDRINKFYKSAEQMIYQQLLSGQTKPLAKKEVDYETDYSIVDSEKNHLCNIMKNE